jgi:hypothetical protein
MDFTFEAAMSHTPMCLRRNFFSAWCSMAPPPAYIKLTVHDPGGLADLTPTISRAEGADLAIAGTRRGSYWLKVADGGVGDGFGESVAE